MKFRFVNVTLALVALTLAGCTAGQSAAEYAAQHPAPHAAAYPALAERGERHPLSVGDSTGNAVFTTRNSLAARGVLSNSAYATVPTRD